MTALILLCCNLPARETKSARGLAHSKTLVRTRKSLKYRKVLDCDPDASGPLFDETQISEHTSVNSPAYRFSFQIYFRRWRLTLSWVAACNSAA